MPVVPLIAGVLLSVILIALSVIDVRTLRLPNALTYALVGLGWAYAFWWTGDIVPALIGAGLGYAAFVAVEIAYRAWRGRDGLGRGDAKLLAAGGAWCGWEGLPFIVMIATATALAAVVAFGRGMERDARVPFGPFLAAGIGVTYWAGLIIG